MNADEEESSLKPLVEDLISRGHAAGVAVPPAGELEAIATDAMRALRAKDGMRRFKLSIKMVSELLEEGPALLQGSHEQRERDWSRCASSVVSLWLTAARAWESKSDAVAAALSITCMEETGKLAVERWRLFGVQAITSPPATEWRRRGALSRDHLTKQVLAAVAGALINSRLDQVLGTGFVTAFLDDAEEGRLARFREDCLYLGRKNGELHVPAESISSYQAAQYVALSGEVLAEILPDPGAWSRVLDRVKDFEESAAIRPD